MLVVRCLLLPVIIVTFSVSQRTYQRHCDCEYSADGRCAYTLLLPTTSSGDMTCPLVNSSVSLQNDVSELKRWTGEQAKAVVTLQNSVNTLTAAVERLQDAQIGQDAAEKSSRTAYSQSSAIDDVKAAVDQLNRTVLKLTTLCSDRCSDDTDLTKLERELATKYRLCAVRGLILNSIDNSTITASSVDQSASTSDVRISTSSAGWCPSHPGEYV